MMKKSFLMILILLLLLLPGCSPGEPESPTVASLPGSAPDIGEINIVPPEGNDTPSSAASSADEEKTTEAAEPETTSLSTEAETTAASAAEAETTAAPTVPETTAAPTEAETTAAPTVPETTAAPTVPETTAAPTEAETTAAPTVPETTAAPTEAETTAAPTVPETTAAPAEKSRAEQLLAEAGFPAEQLIGSQLIIVRGEGGTACSLHFFQKNGGIWEEALPSASGFTGRTGIGEHSEGSGNTPSGYYALGPAFGSMNEPVIDMPFTKLQWFNYWISDPTSPYYNQMVDGRKIDIRPYANTEDLYEMAKLGQYTYSIVIQYNMNPVVPGRGSAIFLHVDTRPTSGCIGTSEDVMKSVFSWIHAGLSPHILIYNP